MSQNGRLLAGLSGVLLSLLLVGTAFAHLERPSYWPDPAPDTSITPPAGGGVPKARSLASAVGKQKKTKPTTDVRVVCQGSKGATSLKLAKKSIKSAVSKGFQLRPSQPVEKLTQKEGDKLLKINEKLAAKCKFKDVQSAINASGNNDRVVIMPGTYTEPKSRAAKLNDPKCNPSLLQNDASGDPTPSYAYQTTCPHDQNLIYVQGREVKGKALATPRGNRQGIPEQELGPCVRCNFQIEGSGPKPEDVILDAGSGYKSKSPEAKPSGHAKHVVLRADRTDGFVGRNFLTRGALEFGFYTEESDGVFLDKLKMFWNDDYGHLAFTSDHQWIQNCDAMGAGDAALYPGAAPETGSQATDFYPDAPRYNTTVTKCDMRNSALGYSGSMGNAVRITNNHIYGNAAGIASDTLSSAGHPGYPADSVKIDHNFIYSNNFNVYAEGSPVKPLVGVPNGAGVVFAGMNDSRIHGNWFFDNWREAVFLFAVPDAFTSNGGPEGDVFPGVSCTTAGMGVSTSCGNRIFGNRMGQVPPGFKFPAKLDEYKVPHAADGSTKAPNGNDFWWDEWSGNTANCWYSNEGPNGDDQSITGPGDAGRNAGAPPQVLPGCNNGADPGSSVGAGDPAKTQYLVECSNGPDKDTGPLDCDWWSDPVKPGSAQAKLQERARARAGDQFAGTPQAVKLQKRIDLLVEPHPGR